MQPQGHVQILCNIIDFGMNVQEAGDAARFHHQGSTEPTAPLSARGEAATGTSISRMTAGGWVALESGVPMDTQRGLAHKGHDVRFESDGFGGYQGIMYDARRDTYFGGSDSRKDGQAAGY
jgi:gamma-glutamyltranspeptidase/glutathione hydrolase